MKPQWLGKMCGIGNVVCSKKVLEFPEVPAIALNGIRRIALLDLQHGEIAINAFLHQLFTPPSSS
jgi:hypothetical protein